MEKANKIFSLFFLVLAIAETIGFLGGRNWCFFAAIILFGLSMMFRIDSIIKSQHANQRKEVPMKT